jgi:hypothetical protein
MSTAAPSSADWKKCWRPPARRSKRRTQAVEMSPQEVPHLAPQVVQHVVPQVAPQ